MSKKKPLRRYPRVFPRGGTGEGYDIMYEPSKGDAHCVGHLDMSRQECRVMCGAVNEKYAKGKLLW